MAVALVNHGAVLRNNSGVCAVTLNMTGATGLIAGVVTSHFAASNVIADSSSNTWVPLTAIDGPSITIQLFYSVAPTVSSSQTFTFTNTNVVLQALAVAGFSGVKLSSPLDQQTGAFASGVTSQAPGSITPVENNELIISLLGHAETSPTGISIGSGFTLLDQQPYINGPTFFGIGIALAYKVQTALAAVNPTWTQIVTDDMTAGIASWKSTSAALGGSPGQMMMTGVGT